MNFSIYDQQGELRARTAFPEDAGMFVALLGDGATIRYRSRGIVWTEGKEKRSASESYDFVAETIAERIGF